MSTGGTSEQLDKAVSADERGIDLFDILLILSDDRKRIAIAVLVAMVLGVAVAYILKPTFTASALILPPQQSQSLASSMMGQLGSLLSLAGGGAVKTPADLYIGILESRTIADDIIARFNLQKVYKTKKIEDARTALRSNSRFLTGKDGLIHILVEDHDPNRASEIANGYVDELYAMNSHLAITEAAQRRVFFDQELADSKNALAKAENDLKQTEEHTGVIQLTGQAQSIIVALAQLRAQIVSKEVELQAMHTFATDQNPDAERLQEEITSLRSQLAQFEKDPHNQEASLVGIPAGQVPTVGLEYERRLRDVKYQESLVELLSEQYEAARIDEAKASPLIQVVDRAIPPQKKTGPHRLYVMLGFGFVGFFFAYMYSATSRLMHHLEEDPEYAFKIQRLKSGFRLRRS